MKNGSSRGPAKIRRPCISVGFSSPTRNGISTPLGVVHVPACTVLSAPPSGDGTAKLISNVYSSSPATNAGRPPAVVAVTGRRRKR